MKEAASSTVSGVLSPLGSASIKNFNSKLRDFPFEASLTDPCPEAPILPIFKLVSFAWNWMDILYTSVYNSLKYFTLSAALTSVLSSLSSFLHFNVAVATAPHCISTTTWVAFGVLRTASGKSNEMISLLLILIASCWNVLIRISIYSYQSIS